GHRPQYLSQYFVLLAEDLYAAFADEENVIDALNGARSMCNDNRYAPTCAHTEDCSRQSFLPFGVEVRIRLIENHKERIEVERAGKCNPLALAGGQSHAAFADLRAIAFGQRQDELVYPCRLSGDHHGV